jgi:pyridoxal phosphate enzyme (YggS family)
MQSLKDQYDAVRQRMAQAIAKAPQAQDVHLLAVSKTVPPERVAALVALGQVDFGENYIQEGLQKIQAVAQLCPNQRVVWHCIGPIQSNKTRSVAEHFDWVHSIDRLKIAQRLSEQRSVHLPPLQVCIQVNIDEQASKSGVAVKDALPLALAIRDLPRLQLRGLMTIPEPVSDYAQQWATHVKAKQLFDEMAQQLALPCFDTLSMGMTADLEAAIEAGSTMVRIGTAIFGSRL